MGKLLTEVRDRALKRPWLLAPPLLGLLAQNVASIFDGGSVVIRMLLLAALTSAVTALFAELWLGDGWSVKPARLADAWKLFLLPYPLLLVFGLLTTPLVYWVLHAEQTQSYSMAIISLVLGAGKIVAFALCGVSTFALLRRSDASGAWGALKLGARSVAANAGWLLRLFIGLWLFQEACVYLAKQLAPGFVLAGFFTTAIPLFGCVALPIEAWRSGTLSKP
ncbi:MAG: hypothetical protein HY923_00235 [Elusimicrobia bacterium]|nr:hypothetical protein [Elusimicrobiota bacterium]